MFGSRVDTLDGCVWVYREEIFDARGFFKYVFQSSDFGKKSETETFSPKQVNHSFSKRGVLRGLHLEPWDKYLYVPSGEVSVCVIDLRSDSPQYGSHMLARLGNFEGGRAGLFVPKGMANGFYCIEDTHYLNFVSAEYSESGRTGFLWNDPSLGINWDISGTPILSDQDRSWPLAPNSGALGMGSLPE